MALFANTPPKMVDTKKLEQEIRAYEARSEAEKKAQEEFYGELAKRVDQLRSEIRCEGYKKYSKDKELESAIKMIPSIHNKS